MSKVRYEKSQMVGRMRPPRDAITGVALTPVRCDCRHGQHDAHWVRAPKGRGRLRKLTQKLARSA